MVAVVLTMMTTGLTGATVGAAATVSDLQTRTPAIVTTPVTVAAVTLAETIAAVTDAVLF